MKRWTLAESEGPEGAADHLNVLLDPEFSYITDFLGEVAGRLRYLVEDLETRRSAPPAALRPSRPLCQKLCQSSRIRSGQRGSEVGEVRRSEDVQVHLSEPDRYSRNPRGPGLPPKF